MSSRSFLVWVLVGLLLLSGTARGTDCSQYNIGANFTSFPGIDEGDVVDVVDGRVRLTHTIFGTYTAVLYLNTHYLKTETTEDHQVWTENDYSWMYVCRAGAPTMHYYTSWAPSGDGEFFNFGTPVSCCSGWDSDAITALSEWSYSAHFVGHDEIGGGSYLLDHDVLAGTVVDGSFCAGCPGEGGGEGGDTDASNTAGARDKTATAAESMEKHLDGESGVVTNLLSRLNASRAGDEAYARGLMETIDAGSSSWRPTVGGFPDTGGMSTWYVHGIDMGAIFIQDVGGVDVGFWLRCFLSVACWMFLARQLVTDLAEDVRLILTAPQSTAEAAGAVPLFGSASAALMAAVIIGLAVTFAVAIVTLVDVVGFGSSMETDGASLTDSTTSLVGYLMGPLSGLYGMGTVMNIVNHYVPVATYIAAATLMGMWIFVRPWLRNIEIGVVRILVG